MSFPVGLIRAQYTTEGVMLAADTNQAVTVGQVGQIMTAHGTDVHVVLVVLMIGEHITGAVGTIMALTKQ